MPRGRYAGKQVGRQARKGESFNIILVLALCIIAPRWASQLSSAQLSSTEALSDPIHPSICPSYQIKKQDCSISRFELTGLGKTTPRFQGRGGMGIVARKLSMWLFSGTIIRDHGVGCGVFWKSLLSPIPLHYLFYVSFHGRGGIVKNGLIPSSPHPLPPPTFTASSGSWCGVGGSGGWMGWMDRGFFSWGVIGTLPRRT